VTTASSERIGPPAAPGTQEAGESESWEFEEGDEIAPGRFALEELGGGYQYQAYLAWDERRASLVVAKLVRPHLVGDELVGRNLRREAEMLERLAHPVIVRGFGAALDGPRPHLVMEHLEGPPLSTSVRRFGPLAIEQTLPLAFQMATALWYLGNEGVAHLDVKPRNIILGLPPRLIDLSVARSFKRARAIASPIGTDAYMAPEQCDPSLGEIGSPADVWGLGATLHHAVSGQVPFPRPDDYDAADPDERFPQLHEFPRTLPESCPPALEMLILDCLEPATSARPTPQELTGALEPLLDQVRQGRILGRSRPRIR
jgi:eukaryotic-like serine/threonine-protein kinase